MSIGRIRWAGLVVALMLGFGLTASPALGSGERAAPPDFFGVNGWNTARSDFNQMEGADVGIYRANFPFELARSVPGQPYDWSYFDELVSNTTTNGITLIPILYGVPPWRSAGLSSTPVHDRVSRDQWHDLLVAMVRRYGPDGAYWKLHPAAPYRPIETWQVWNEPNSKTWWGPKPDPREYATLLRRSSRTIHDLDPAAEVLTAGIVARPTNPYAIKGPRFLRKLLAARGVAAAVDGVAYHPYAATVRAVNSQLTKARSVLDHAGVRVPLWVTEIGWGTDGPLEHPLIKSRTGQQQALSGTFEMLLRQRVRLRISHALWYLWQDRTDTLCMWCQSSGLLDADANPKRLLQIYRDFARR